MSNVGGTYRELLSIAEKMDGLAERACHEDIQRPLELLEEATKEIGRASSGSWIGYHANVYHRDLKPPPRREYFNPQLGIDFSSSNWIEFNAADISKAIYERAGDPDPKRVENFHSEAVEEFDQQKTYALSNLEIELSKSNDGFLANVRDRVNELSPATFERTLDGFKPPQTPPSSDEEAVYQGVRVPPHISIRVKIYMIRQTLHVVAELAKLTRRAAEHILRVIQSQQGQHEGTATGIVGTKIFIGHGSSPVWRELKDFLENTLRLQVDEFNRIPVAGKSNKERLLEMLDSATMAFLVMTAEDEQPDGQFHPRMNVVHEAGLFQGRLGFERAIVLLEDDCEEFSNIEGITQIRFPKDNIMAKSEEIRGVLRREGLLGSTDSGGPRRLAQKVKPTPNIIR